MCLGVVWVIPAAAASHSPSYGFAAAAHSLSLSLQLSFSLSSLLLLNVDRRAVCQLSLSFLWRGLKKFNLAACASDFAVNFR